MNSTTLSKKTKLSLSFISMVLNGKRDAGRRAASIFVKAVPGTIIMDWLFAKKNHKKLSKIVRSIK
jgi:hypothetical protein